MTPYKALWRTSINGHGVEYNPVTVISAPLWGHVKCLSERGNNWALPVAELVGVEGDSYAVVTRR